MTSHPPEWRKAWKLDDPAWMKQRRADWKAVKEKLPIVGWFLDRSAQTTLKNYFMTGCGYKPEPPEEEWEELHYRPDDPLYNVRDAMLFEYWLHPEPSEQSWKSITERHELFGETHASARSRFRELISKKFPDDGDLFGGLEERLYRLFTPIRCRPEDYPELDHRTYLRRCWSTHADLAKPIREYLCAKKINPANIAPVLVREWCDCVPGAYEDKRRKSKEVDYPVYLDFVLQKDLGGKIVLAHKIGQHPTEYDPRQVAVAREILARLSRMELPDDLKAFAAPYLDSVDYPLPEDS